MFFHNKEKVMSGYRVHSVGLLLRNSLERYLVLQELQAKPEIGKIPGEKDLSFPWETKRDGERDIPALHRLLREEVDATDEIQISLPVFIGAVPVYDTLAWVYAAQAILVPNKMYGSDEGTEIKSLGWQSREFLLSRCRDGVPAVFRLWDQYQAELMACSA
ncbi:MAG: hypothetical protein WA082_00085 [Candidatus Moraniibacteriota bacterium]